MYMPNKPAKYSIKVQILADAKIHYMCMAEIYAGAGNKNKENFKLANHTRVVLRLAAPTIGTNRNITADNWYSSVELVEEAIPLEFHPNRKRLEKLSLFGFTSSTTLASFVPKKGRSVILLSSMHHDVSVNKDSQKPEIIHLYNDTKSGVDSLDAKCACIPYKEDPRDGLWLFKYIEKLGFQLLKPLLRKRIENKKVPMKLRVLAAEILEIPLPDTQTSVERLHVHLKTKHHIEDLSKKVLENAASSSSASTSSSSRMLSAEPPSITTPKRMKITDHFPIQNNENSMEARVARMAAKDGLPLSVFVTSSDL
ncbi:hypothetical protein ILUMI_10913 [Ignelater luminosus]|uniref:PiggyBac transposable element-derived protein domain-containing protein n=1 Tax=Ignelater luminosus TaxID=2038154 RepID=A0A8K0CZH3_IGNLU|nr:hypothetical protein ILUMI_10913 [Ignelater luminosus]